VLVNLTLMSADLQSRRPLRLKLRAIIIGGGIAGLTAARALLDVGCSQVLVYERREKADMLSGALTCNSPPLWNLGIRWTVLGPKGDPGHAQMNPVTLLLVQGLLAWAWQQMPWQRCLC
jgi:hypothetical protein